MTALTLLDIDYEQRRGYIAITDSNTSAMRCLHCGAVWMANTRPGGGFYRGSWPFFHNDVHR